MKKALLLFVLLFLFPVPVFAKNQESSSFISVVNPVRISSYDQDSGVSLAAQYLAVQKRDLPATWLLTFDALFNPQVQSIMHSMDNKQEFGYYPTSVGAWWVDSYSLDYMRQKYGITANLGVADQYSTDGYSVWGTYWSTPYYPSKINAAMPANEMTKKLDVVNLEWAARDPLNGYGSGEASRFSTQDYKTVGLSDEYFTKLVNLYGEAHGNQFGQITVGLESDLPPESYSQTFAVQLDIVKNLSQTGDFQVATMKDFAAWYRNKFQNLSPVQAIQADDLLGKPMKVIWYQSPYYRISLTYDEQNKTIKIIDWRIYQDNFQEPYFTEPNNQLNLYINVPSLVDSVNNPHLFWQINKNLPSDEQSGNTLTLNFSDKSNIVFLDKNVTLNGSGFGAPVFVRDSGLVDVNNSINFLKIIPQKSLAYSPPGFTFRSLKPEILSRLTLQRLTKKKNLMLESLGIILFLGGIYFLFKVGNKQSLSANKKLVYLCWTIVTIGLLFVGVKESRIYYVSQDELEALLYLKQLPGGDIVVPDSSCLNCGFNTVEMPAVFINKRSYVGQFSGDNTVSDKTIFDTQSREEGKAELQKLGVKYIYLTKYGSHIESLPFSPGDYNVEKIYENGNAQIWEVKN